MCAWLKKNAQKARNFNALLAQVVHDQYKQNEGHCSDESVVFPFLDLDSITEPRSQETRLAVYKCAKKQLRNIVLKCTEYHVMTPRLHEIAFNTDYDALRHLNDSFDMVDNLQPEAESGLQRFQRHFSHLMQLPTMGNPNEQKGGA